MREIVFYPDPVLFQKCRELDIGPYFLGEPIKENLRFGWVDKSGKPINDFVKELVADMKSILYSTKNGVGLAAPQVGVDLRIFIMSVDRKVDPVVAINPTYSEPHGEVSLSEGCLSVPGVGGKVVRPASILVKGWDLDAEPFSFRAEKDVARICQHEIDHLDGKLFFEKFAMFDRKRAEPALAKLERQYKQWNERKTK